jgi:hypothetical protein
MTTDNRYLIRLPGLVAGGAMAALILITAVTSSTHAEEAEEGHSFDGLKRVENSEVAKAYIDPEADFSVYRRVKILEPYVAFRKNWQRDQNRQGIRSVSARDIERIKADVASLFEQVFTEELEAGDGFEVVDVTGDDVLLLRPAVIDLDISAPDTASAGRSRTYTASAGAATLYIELYDSVTGGIIGRAADRQTIRSASSSVSWSNRVTNSADARRLLRRWAKLLRSFLDQHYTK